MSEVNVIDFMQAMLNDQPNKASEYFNDIMDKKLEANLNDKYDEVAKNYFNSADNSVEEIETEDE